MKKKIILAASVAIVAAAAFCGISSAVRISSKNDILNQNVEALSEMESSKNDGALWSNPQGNVFCCGPGNVRDCDESGIPRC